MANDSTLAHAVKVSARHHDACEHCHSSLQCNSLKLALALLDQSPASRALRHKLEEIGWNNSQGASPCALSFSPARIKEITDEFIRLNQKSKGLGPSPQKVRRNSLKAPPPDPVDLEQAITNLYLEEICHE